MRRLFPVAAALFVMLPAASALARKKAEGKPAVAATAEGVYLWHDAQGWHLRTAQPPRSQHSYQGVVRPFDGELSRQKATGARVKLDATSPKSIHFELESITPANSTGGDGFDWDGTAECMTFELRVDKLPKVDRVHVGASGESPSAMPFDACK